MGEVRGGVENQLLFIFLAPTLYTRYCLYLINPNLLTGRPFGKETEAQGGQVASSRLHSPRPSHSSARLHSRPLRLAESGPELLAVPRAGCGAGTRSAHGLRVAQAE